MFETLRTVIMAGGYRLSEMTERAATLYAVGELDASQLKTLLDLAREHATAEAEYAPLEQRVTAIEQWRTGVDASIAKLAPASDETGDGSESAASEYPLFVQPTGANDAYVVGAKVLFDDARWVCALDGCVWSPKDYPTAWKQVEDAPAEPPAGGDAGASDGADKTEGAAGDKTEGSTEESDKTEGTPDETTTVTPDGKTESKE